MERCEAYRRLDGLFAFPQVEWQRGIWLPVDRVIRLAGNEPAEEIGRAALELLMFSGRSVPPITSPREARRKLLAALRFRGWTAFTRRARAVSLIREDAVVTVTPSISQGNGQFSFIDARAGTCPDQPADVGRLLLAKLEECET